MLFYASPEGGDISTALGGILNVWRGDTSYMYVEFVCASMLTLVSCSIVLMLRNIICCCLFFVDYLLRRVAIAMGAWLQHARCLICLKCCECVRVCPTGELCVACLCLFTDVLSRFLFYCLMLAADLLSSLCVCVSVL